VLFGAHLSGLGQGCQVSGVRKYRIPNTDLIETEGQHLLKTFGSGKPYSGQDLLIVRKKLLPKKWLHLTGILLRSIPAGEPFVRYKT
jgi:hypothetical protein